ncbi:hypothetical protein QQS21_011733 [Conoideocrella luteorostrata]|uniref:Major facilitator superfamily (MFS) profile domain-containing protein n=1 Tax=Conoideocrella luteorostrata TaxID=1105319 RepID=A0AAJ0CH39_9HYPO|nr:hypothetical protein QQS21_011733 [Conoideocrella luteorostrata]
MQALLASCIIAGTGLGALQVTCPISIVEIVPPEIRGILTSWFVVLMGLAHGVSTFCVYGVYLDPRLQGKNLQFQIVWIAPIIFMTLLVCSGFFLCESPRWLFLAGGHEEAAKTLVRLRGQPATSERVQKELQDIEQSIREERRVHSGDNDDGSSKSSTWSIMKETFTVPLNLRRVQQCLILYSLLDGASKRNPKRRGNANASTKESDSGDNGLSRQDSSKAAVEIWEHPGERRL